jgi:hypothetical protein
MVGIAPKYFRGHMIGLAQQLNAQPIADDVGGELHSPGSLHLCPSNVVVFSGEHSPERSEEG